MNPIKKFKENFLFITFVVIFLTFVAGFFSNLDADYEDPVKLPREVKVMVIDTGVDYLNPIIGKHIPKEYKKIENYDNYGHGTHVSGIVMNGVCSQVKLIPCKFAESVTDSSSHIDREVACLREAVRLNVDVVNFSGGGEGPDKREFYLLRQLGARNTVVVVAAGNNGQKLTLDNHVTKLGKKLKNGWYKGRFYYYPASYKLKNLIKVSSYYQNGDRVLSSNYSYSKGFVKQDGSNVESYVPGGEKEYMQGTSQAAAKFTNRILKTICENYRRP